MPELHDVLVPGFSGVVRVIVDGRVLLERAAGRTRFGGGAAIGLGTRFATASIAKMFTAVCVARLVERGSCSLDQPLTDVLPEFAGEFEPHVTIDRLLSHRSGLGDYIDDDATLPFTGMPVESLDRPRAFVPYLLPVPRRTPDEFFYSSAGYVLLGLCIEALTSRTYYEAIRELVTKPAGLEATDFGRVDDPAEDFAWGYLDDGKPNVPHQPIRGGPDGGIVTNVPDLERFLRWLRDGAATSDELRRLWSPVSRLDEQDAYGRGFDVLSRCGRTWFGHTGSDPGVSARAVCDVASESSVVVLSNRSSIAFAVFRRVFDALGATLTGE